MRIDKEIPLKKLAVGLTAFTLGISLIMGTRSASADSYSVANTYSRINYQSPSILSRVMDHRVAKQHFKKSELPLKKAIEEAFVESKEKSLSFRTFAGDKDKAEGTTATDILEQLKKELGPNVESEYTLLLVNDTFLNHNTIAYVIKKSGRIINTMSEYQALVQEMLTTNKTEQEVYASINFKKSFSDVLLHANGLSLLPRVRRYNIINGVEMYGANYKLSTSAEELSQYSDNTLQNMSHYLENDEKIWDLIQKSGVLNKKTDEEKVKAWSDYVQRNFPYDIKTLGTRKGAYNFSSSIFAVTERQKAMCVGYSTLSARAFNMMGIRAYVVYGYTSSGGKHAVTRAYYNDAWHFVDTTAAEGASIVSHDIDTYLETESYATNNQMVVNKAFEQWAKKQRARDLLLINTQMGQPINKRDDEFILDNEYIMLQKRQQFIRERYQYIVENVKKHHSENQYLLENVESFLKAVEQDQEDTNNSKLLLGSLADRYTERLTIWENQAGAIEYQLSIKPFRDGQSFTTITRPEEIQSNEELNLQIDPVQQFNDSGYQGDSESLRLAYEQLHQKYESLKNPIEKETVAKQLQSLSQQIETKQDVERQQISGYRSEQQAENRVQNVENQETSIRDATLNQSTEETLTQTDTSLGDVQHLDLVSEASNEEMIGGFMGGYLSPVLDYAIPVFGMIQTIASDVWGSIGSIW